MHKAIAELKRRENDAATVANLASLNEGLRRIEAKVDEALARLPAPEVPVTPKKANRQ